MYTKEQINEQSNRVLEYIKHFLELPFGNTESRMKLGISSDSTREFCSLCIGIKGHKSYVSLDMDMVAKNKLYNQVFWGVFNIYHNHETISMKKGINSDEKKESHWEIELNNSINNNKVILEFSIQNYMDFMWIQEAFQSWDDKMLKGQKK